MKIFQELKASKYYSFRIVIEKIIDNSLGLFLFQYQKKNNMFNWFYNCLKHQHNNPGFSPQYNYYEFGVCGGGSMTIYILALKKFCKDHKQDIHKYHIFGFDSFSGLPEAQAEDTRNDWSLGVFKAKKDDVISKIKETGFPMANVHLVEGYFEDTLTENLKKTCKKFPPAIINMDADYYSSTMTAFLWLVEFLPSGSYFRFDDIWAFYGHPEKGELKAINDFNKLEKGYLTSFPIFGLESYSYVFCRKKFEYT